MNVVRGIARTAQMTSRTMPTTIAIQDIPPRIAMTRPSKLGVCGAKINANLQ